MANYSRGSVVLVRFPFSDLAGAKVRPAIAVSKRGDGGEARHLHNSSGSDHQDSRFDLF